MYFPRGIELKRCGNDTCNYGAACVDRDDGGNPRCACPRDDSDCPADSRTGSTVCGSDGQTYRSECELLRHSCRFKVHLLITSYTPCRGDKQGQSCNLVLEVEPNVNTKWHGQS